MENQVLTFGQKAVGINFNPSKQSADPEQQRIALKVDRAKTLMAEAIDLMNDFRGSVYSNKGADRHASVAITDLETAQMRMVKAITWKDQ